MRALTALFTLVLTSALPAQTLIPGRVLDAQEKPVANVEVLLHALTDSTGEELSKDTSAADGSFQLGARSLNPGAVYFVTVVYNGELFMGEMMRPPFPRDKEYIVRVGVNPIDLSGGSAGGVQEVTPGPVARKDRTAGIIVIMVAALALVAVALFAFRRRPPAYRRWLVELARLEDDLVHNPNDGVLLKRREELRNRLLSD